MVKAKRVGADVVIYEDSAAAEGGQNDANQCDYEGASDAGDYVEECQANSNVKRRAPEAAFQPENTRQERTDFADDETDEAEDPYCSDPDSMLEDAEQFQQSFKGISDRYKLMGRIGEGTFSTVYKAEDLEYERYQNDWARNDPSRFRKQPRYVAIKKIYVTSSPMRIYNELEILHELRDVKNVCPLITSFRHQDQVIAILSYFEHTDFREYYRDMTLAEMRIYFRSLFQALQGIHQKGIIHRDIKPTNFLYDPRTTRGMLVDFGLAERVGTDYQLCLCEYDTASRKRYVGASVYGQGTYNEVYAVPCYPKHDRDGRHSKRANRAGTRGFRAPEVLFKCTAQGVGLDIWSAGIIMLTIMARRFPFFHSTDDIDALLELTQIFGKAKMRTCALIHGQVMETNIPSYNENGHSFEKIILWATNRAGKDAQGNKMYQMNEDERLAVDLLDACLKLDPQQRITAAETLKHPFLAFADRGRDPDVILAEQGGLVDEDDDEKPDLLHIPSHVAMAQ